MTMSRSELTKILSESPLFSGESDLEEIASRNHIEVIENTFFSAYMDKICKVVVILAVLYFGGHLAAYLLRSM